MPEMAPEWSGLCGFQSFPDDVDARTLGMQRECPFGELVGVR